MYFLLFLLFQGLHEGLKIAAVCPYLAFHGCKDSKSCRIVQLSESFFYKMKLPGITGSVLLIIFKSLISLCFITCLIRISLNLKNNQKNRPHDPACRKPAMGTGTPAMGTEAPGACGINSNLPEKFGSMNKKAYLCA